MEKDHTSGGILPNLLNQFRDLNMTKFQLQLRSESLQNINRRYNRSSQQSSIPPLLTATNESSGVNPLHGNTTIDQLAESTVNYEDAQIS
jgi:hypothetical protein